MRLWTLLAPLGIAARRGDGRARRAGPGTRSCGWRRSWPTRCASARPRRGCGLVGRGAGSDAARPAAAVDAGWTRGDPAAAPASTPGWPPGGPAVHPGQRVGGRRVVPPRVVGRAARLDGPPGAGPGARRTPRGAPAAERSALETALAEAADVSGYRVDRLREALGRDRGPRRTREPRDPGRPGVRPGARPQCRPAGRPGARPAARAARPPAPATTAGRRPRSPRSRPGRARARVPGSPGNPGNPDRSASPGRNTDSPPGRDWRCDRGGAAGLAGSRLISGRQEPGLTQGRVRTGR